MPKKQKTIVLQDSWEDSRVYMYPVLSQLLLIIHPIHQKQLDFLQEQGQGFGLIQPLR